MCLVLNRPWKCRWALDIIFSRMALFPTNFSFMRYRLELKPWRTKRNSKEMLHMKIESMKHVVVQGLCTCFRPPEWELHNVSEGAWQCAILHYRFICFIHWYFNHSHPNDIFVASFDGILFCIFQNEFHCTFVWPSVWKRILECLGSSSSLCASYFAICFLYFPMSLVKKQMLDLIRVFATVLLHRK